MSVTYHPLFLEEILKQNFDKEFLNNDWPKLKQAAEVHGYRGASKKKHNGIVPIRPTDTNLLKTLSQLSKDDPTDHKNDLPIKVVAHCPSGNRLVGYLNSNGNIIIYGLANYN
jgi:hypothetical protein